MPSGQPFHRRPAQSPKIRRAKAQPFLRLHQFQRNRTETAVQDTFISVEQANWIISTLDMTGKSGWGIIVLSHYPIPCFNNHYYGWYHLYAHVHNSFEWNMMERVKYEMEALYDKPCHMYNVGCMMSYMGYRPRTLEEIISKNSEKSS